MSKSFILQDGTCGSMLDFKEGFEASSGDTVELRPQPDRREKADCLIPCWGTSSKEMRNIIQSSVGVVFLSRVFNGHEQQYKERPQSVFILLFGF